MALEIWPPHSICHPSKLEPRAVEPCLAWLLHKKNTWKIKNGVFPTNTRKYLVGKGVRSIKVHAYAEFGDDYTSFNVSLALTQVAWVESHTNSYMIACFVRGSDFSLRYAVSSDCTWN